MLRREYWPLRQADCGQILATAPSSRKKRRRTDGRKSEELRFGANVPSRTHRFYSVLVFRKEHAIMFIVRGLLVVALVSVAVLRAMAFADESSAPRPAVSAFMESCINEFERARTETARL